MPEQPDLKAQAAGRSVLQESSRPTPAKALTREERDELHEKLRRDAAISTLLFQAQYQIPGAKLPAHAKQGLHQLYCSSCNTTGRFDFGVLDPKKLNDFKAPAFVHKSGQDADGRRVSYLGRAPGTRSQTEEHMDDQGNFSLYDPGLGASYLDYHGFFASAESLMGRRDASIEKLEELEPFKLSIKARQYVVPGTIEPQQAANIKGLKYDELNPKQQAMIRQYCDASNKMLRNNMRIYQQLMYGLQKHVTVEHYRKGEHGPVRPNFYHVNKSKQTASIMVSGNIDYVVASSAFLKTMGADPSQPGSQVFNIDYKQISEPGFKEVNQHGSLDHQRMQMLVADAQVRLFAEYAMAQEKYARGHALRSALFEHQVERLHKLCHRMGLDAEAMQQMHPSLVADPLIRNKKTGELVLLESAQIRLQALPKEESERDLMIKEMKKQLNNHPQEQAISLQFHARLAQALLRQDPQVAGLENEVGLLFTKIKPATNVNDMVNELQEAFSKHFPPSRGLDWAALKYHGAAERVFKDLQQEDLGLTGQSVDFQSKALRAQMVQALQAKVNETAAQLMAGGAPTQAVDETARATAILELHDQLHQRYGKHVSLQQLARAGQGASGLTRRVQDAMGLTTGSEQQELHELRSLLGQRYSAAVGSTLGESSHVVLLSEKDKADVMAVSDPQARMQAEQDKIAARVSAEVSEVQHGSELMRVQVNKLRVAVGKEPMQAQVPVPKEGVSVSVYGGRGSSAQPAEPVGITVAVNEASQADSRPRPRGPGS